MNEELVKDVIIEQDEEQVQSKCRRIASDISRGEMKLVTLVESLGPVLTNVNHKERLQGTRILMHVLQLLPADFLQERELEFIGNFMCNRLKDHHSVIPTILQAILTIASMSRLPLNLPAHLLQSIFQEVHCQSLSQGDRRTVYQILQFFFDSKMEAIQGMELNLVLGVVQVMDSERDPRNLMLLFQILPGFIRSMELGHLAEELFEVMACYFPVDFTPPPHEKYTITREDLASNLQNCLVASPAFCEFCIPLLLEKLDSSLKTAKLDSLRLLKAACQEFELSILKSHVKDIWSAIQSEVCSGVDEDVKVLALSALRELVHAFSLAPLKTGQVHPLDEFLAQVVCELQSRLVEVQFRLFLPSVELLQSISHGCAISSERVLREVFPLLHPQYLKRSSTVECLIVLETLTNLLKIWNEQRKNTEMGEVTIVLPHEKEIYALFLGAARDSDPGIRIRGLQGLCCIYAWLTERDEFYRLLVKELLEEEEATVRQEAVVCLRGAAESKFSEDLKVQVIQKHLLNTKAIGTCEIDENASVRMERCLSAVGEIATVQSFIPHVNAWLVDTLENPKLKNHHLAILDCLSHVVTKGRSVQDYLYSECKIVTKIIQWCVTGVCEETDRLLFKNEAVLSKAATIIRHIVQEQQNNSMLTELTHQCVVFFLDPTSLSDGIIGMSNFQNFKPLGIYSPPSHSQMIALLEAVVGSIQRDVVIPEYFKLVNTLSNIAVETEHAYTHRCASRIVSSIVNKTECEKSVDELLEMVWNRITGALERNDIPHYCRKNAAGLLIWVTKALLLRGHKTAGNYIEMALKLLSNSDVNEVIAEGFEVIMTETEECLNIRSHAIVRVLYRQRFFLCLPQLVTGFQEAPEDVKMYYLIALSHLLRNVPPQVLTMNLAQIVPLLIEGLQQKQEKDSLVLSTMETLAVLLQDSQYMLAEHLQTLIPKFIRISQHAHSMKIKVAALQCLLHCCTFPTYLLLPFKSEVIKGLSMCLDDKKRIVRRETVRARGKWFLVGAPNKPEDR